MVIRDVEHLSTKEYLDVLVEYLKVLQDGRTKPDTKSGGYIRESVYNIEDIEEVKKAINEVLRVNLVPKSVTFIDKTKSNYFKN